MAAPIKVSVDLSGERELVAALSRLEPKASKKLIKGALKVYARKIRQTARDNAPRITGDLRRGIKTQQMRARANAYGTMVLMSTKTMPEFYGAFVDLGTKRTEGEEFLEDAFDQHVEAAARGMENDLWSGILEGWK